MAKSEPKFQQPKYEIVKPYGLSPRSKWMRDYYCLGKGLKREWINEFMPFSTGLTGDRIWNELDFYIVPDDTTDTELSANVIVRTIGMENTHSPL